jgi:hemoglobin
MSETLYEHAGGDDGLHRLEEVFYAKALADPVLKQLFTHRVATHVDHLTWSTPSRSAARRGSPTSS